MKLFIYYCYQTYSERTTVPLYVKANEEKEVEQIASSYIENENKRLGFEYYSKINPALVSKNITELQTIN